MPDVARASIIYIFTQFIVREHNIQTVQTLDKIYHNQTHATANYAYAKLHFRVSDSELCP
jgi:hypothetical protein